MAIGHKHQQPITVGVAALACRGKEPFDLALCKIFPTAIGRVAAFQQSLKETDYVEGRNLTIEYRWAEGQYDRLPALAADLVRRQVTVMTAIGTPAALAAKAATATIPIAFTTADDPMKVGLVASLNRPGGNITGVTTLNVELAPKLLELLHEMVPNATVIGLLVNPDNSAQAESTTREVQIAARKFGIDLHILNAGHEREFDAAFASLRAFRQGLKEIGHVEGQNVTIEYRWAHGQYDRMPAMAVELVRDQVAVIVADTPGVLAAKAATATIPIVFAVAGDPVTAGLVTSMNRPGGNLTGHASLNVQIGPKRLELLHEMVPAAGVIALLVNPTNPNAATISSEAKAAARILGLKLHILHARWTRDQHRSVFY